MTRSNPSAPFPPTALLSHPTIYGPDASTLHRLSDKQHFMSRLYHDFGEPSRDAFTLGIPTINAIDTLVYPTPDSKPVILADHVRDLRQNHTHSNSLGRPLPPRVHAIVIRLHVKTRSHTEPHQLHTDIAFPSAACGLPNIPILTTDANPDPDDLLKLMHIAYFETGDGDSGYATDALDRIFNMEASYIVDRLLYGDNLAAARLATSAISSWILPKLPAGTTFTASATAGTDHLTATANHPLSKTATATPSLAP